MWRRKWILGENKIKSIIRLSYSLMVKRLFSELKIKGSSPFKLVMRASIV